jgi:hypothetical protein
MTFVDCPGLTLPNRFTFVIPRSWLFNQNNQQAVAVREAAVSRDAVASRDGSSRRCALILTREVGCWLSDDGGSFFRRCVL